MKMLMETIQTSANAADTALFSTSFTHPHSLIHLPPNPPTSSAYSCRDNIDDPAVTDNPTTNAAHHADDLAAIAEHPNVGRRSADFDGRRRQ